MKKELLEKIAYQDKEIFKLKKDNEILRSAYKDIKDLAQTNQFRIRNKFAE